MDAGREWLEASEAKVRAAADHIRELREENAALRQRIAELEERPAADTPEDTKDTHWQEERREIRERVERLTRQLAELAG